MTLLRPAPPVRQGNPEVTLVSSANELPVDVRPYEQWRTGLAARGVSLITADARALCASGDLATVTAATDGEFEPFTVYVMHGCEGYVDEMAYRAEANAALADKTAWQVARELWTGTQSGNPSLQSSGVDLGGTADISNVVAALIANMEAELSGGQVFVHVPSIALPGLTNTNMVTRSGARLLTPQGHVVIPGPGYPSAPGDWGPDASAVAASGEVWVFATGPVEYAEGPVTVRDVGQGVAARMNLFEVHVTKPVIVRFDPSKVLAAKATVYTL